MKTKQTKGRRSRAKARQASPGYTSASIQHFGSQLSAPSFHATGVGKPTYVGADIAFSPNMRVGAAAPHEDYPLGGIRLAGMVAPSDGFDTLYNPGSTAANTGAFYATVTANIPPVQFISPTAYGISTVNCAFNMFSSHAVRNIAPYFRRFRFRKLNMVYSTNIGTTTAGNLQVAYERDVNVAYANAGLLMTQSDGQGQKFDRFPYWEPVRRVPIISDSRSRLDDELFVTTSAGDGLTLATTSAAVLNQYFQGAVLALNSGYITTNVTTIGKYFWEFELDLYGFSATAAASFSLLDQKSATELRILRERGVIDASSRPLVVKQVSDAKSLALQATLEKSEDEKKFRSVELVQLDVSRQARATAHPASTNQRLQKSAGEGADEEYELPDLDLCAPTPLPTPNGIPRDSRAAAVKAAEARRSH
jgi:hypothetical protein